jgi:hypothetical protein
MAREVHTGETVRITAKDLTHADTGSVTVGADVTISMYDVEGEIIGIENIGVAEGDDWYFDLTMPDDPGQVTVKVVATVDGATAKDSLQLTVRPF